jgi:Tfp pilus assembly protein PilF
MARAAAADEGLLGHVEFQVSCNQRAQATFNMAVAWLHSFEYERAGATFDEAPDRDPSCSMAYWGMAQSLWHQLRTTPPNSADLVKGADPWYSLGCVAVAIL